MKKDSGTEVISNKRTKALEKILVIISIASLIVSVIILIATNDMKNNFYGDDKNKVESNDSADGTNFLEMLTDENIGKEVSAVGFMNTYLSEDLTAGWLMTMPYLRDVEIQSGDFKYVTLIAKKGEQLKFSEYAVSVKGILEKDADGNWYITNCDIRTFSDGSEGKLEQFNQLVHMGYFREFTNKINEIHSVLNENGHTSHDNKALSSLEQTLESSYSDVQLMHEAAHIVKDLIGLYRSIDEAQHNGSLSAKIEEYNSGAQDVYNNFYHHMESFGLSN